MEGSEMGDSVEELVDNFEIDELPDTDRELLGIEDELNSLRCRRDRHESIFDPLRYKYYDPPCIAKLLAFTVFDQKEKLDDLICKINSGFEIGQIKKRHIQDIEKYLEELGEMITADPRLGDLLQMEFLNRIIHLLKHEENPRLQGYAAIIFDSIVAFSSNKNDVDVVIQSITPVVLRLICSRCPSTCSLITLTWAKVQALWLLRNLVFKISISEEVLASVTSIILKDSVGFGMLHPTSEILSSLCGAHPKLSHEKLKLVLSALLKLIESEYLELLTSGCWGFAQLCDGREEIIIKDKDLQSFIHRFVNLLNHTSHSAIISGLVSLGSIARWGSDVAIEAIIKEKDSLRLISIFLEEGDMYMVKQICWMISNITARKGKHIRALIDGLSDCKLIVHLVNIVRNCELEDVVKEALWALSNAMCDVDPDHKVCLLETCSGLFSAELLSRFDADIHLVLVIIEGLVKIGAVQVFCEGVITGVVELQLLFKAILRDSDLCSRDDGFQKADSKLTCHLHVVPLRDPVGKFEVYYKDGLKVDLE